MHKHVYRKPKKGDVFKSCSCGKRRKIVSIQRDRTKNKNIAMKLWKNCVLVRDGYGCMIQKTFPEIPLPHSQIFMADHFYPRGDHNLFYEVSNGTMLCGNCNGNKNNGSIYSTTLQMAVKEIVYRREGQKKFDEMYQIHISRKPNHDFDRPWYLEAVIKELSDRMEMILPVAV